MTVVAVTWSSKLTISALPELAAQCNGDQPIVLNTLTSAPLCNETTSDVAVGVGGDVVEGFM